MSRKLAPLAAALLLVLPSASFGGTTLFGAPEPHQAELQAWINESLVPTPPVPVLLHPEACPTAFDEACSSDEPFEVWIYQSGEPAQERLELMREVGHVFSDALFTTADQEAFERIDGKPHTEWDPGEENRADSPHEDFGDDYAWCAVHGSTGSGLPTFPIYGNIAEACALIQRVAAHPQGTRGQTLSFALKPRVPLVLHTRPIPANVLVSVVVQIDGKTVPAVESEGLVALAGTRNVDLRLTSRSRQAPMTIRAISLAGKHRIRITLRFVTSR